MTLSFNRDDPSTWGCFKPLIMAHDVGRSRDRSTAVIGGNCPIGSQRLGITELIELPQGLYGAARASELAVIDRRYHSNALIVVDVSNDESYAEVLYDMLGGTRLIGLHITRSGDGMLRGVFSASQTNTASVSTIAGFLPVPAATPVPAAAPTPAPIAAPFPPPAIAPINAPTAVPPPILVMFDLVCDSPLITIGRTVKG